MENKTKYSITLSEESPSTWKRSKELRALIKERDKFKTALEEIIVESSWPLVKEIARKALKSHGK